MLQNELNQISENTEEIKDDTKSIKTIAIKSYHQERHKRVWDALLYSYQKIDALIIAISGAGIYVCLETIKYYTQTSSSINGIIKLSALLFLFSILLNFISQRISAKIHSNDYLVLDIKLTCAEDNIDETLHAPEFEKYENQNTYLDKLHNILANFSIAYMIAGLFGLILFFIFIF